MFTRNLVRTLSATGIAGAFLVGIGAPSVQAETTCTYGKIVSGTTAGGEAYCNSGGQIASDTYRVEIQCDGESQWRQGIEHGAGQSGPSVAICSGPNSVVTDIRVRLTPIF